MLRSPGRTEVRAALVGVLVARTALNSGLRVVYPFLPEIARGLGVSLAAVAGLVALRSLVGLGAPLAARAAETLGRRTLMLGALVVAVVGCVVTGSAPSLAVAGAGFLLVGAAKPAFDVPMQGWFGARVPFARRGRVLGATELSWALSLLVVVPVSGLLIAATSWRAPFFLVAAMTLVGAAVLWSLMAPDRPAMPQRRPLRLDARLVTMLAVVLLFSLAAELLFVVYGAWLEDDFGLSVAAIGIFTMVVAGAELAGEGSVSAFADRLGLRRSILAGLLGSAAAYACLGLVGSALGGAVIAVVAWFVAFEVTIVSTIPFVSELAAESRERLLSLMVAVIALGRAGGAVLAPAVYAVDGIRTSGFAAAACVLLAAALLLRVPSPPGTRVSSRAPGRPGR